MGEQTIVDVSNDTALATAAGRVPLVPPSMTCTPSSRREIENVIFPPEKVACAAKLASVGRRSTTSFSETCLCLSLFESSPVFQKKCQKNM